MLCGVITVVLNASQTSLVGLGMKHSLGVDMGLE